MDPSSAPLPSATQLGSFGGPVLLAYLFNWGLHGILIVQIYNYYIAFPKDLLWCKILVYGVFLLESAQTIIVTRDAFDTFASGFGNPNELSGVHTSWFTVPVVGGVVGLIAKVFYSYRITILSRSYVTGAIVAVIALASSGAAITAGLLIRQAGSLMHLEQQGIFITTAIWLTGSAASDLVITAFMVYFLIRRDTGFRHTHLLVNKVLRVTIETNATTAIVATIGAILFIHLKDHDFHVTATASLTKLYANTLFVIFNDRIKIVGGRNTIETTDNHQMESFIWREPFNNEGNSAMEPRHPKRNVSLAFRSAGHGRPQQRTIDGITVRTDVYCDAIQMDRFQVRPTSFLGLTEILSK
ncbi:hypothetical protein BDN72DRAFT_828339 [Pluteus cervinus]|uniref:Uncharacterized protein n=1 Tax=Pluteus cervinus TaxID=181527 RepID=A0ACD3A6L0_9AGAR|nr:hypothetical protein BDN72DRAFT_828339 [Pluteus cervinus]